MNKEGTDKHYVDDFHLNNITYHNQALYQISESLVK